MTVAVKTRSADYLENGVTVDFSARWKFDPSDMQALRTAADGAQTALVNGLDFTVTGGSTDDGGTVTVAVPAVSGTTLSLWTETSRGQTADYDTNDTFPAETHEQRLDDLAMVNQEQDVELARTLRAPRGKAAWAVPPLVAARADTVVGFDGAGEAAILGATALAAIVAPALPEDLRGSPGGNVDAVGLFDALGGMTVPAGTNRIGTTGKSAVGVGGASYIADATANAGLALAHPLFCKVDAGGRYFRLLPQLDGKVPFLAAGAVTEAAYEATRLYALAIGAVGIELGLAARPLSSVIAQLHAGVATTIIWRGDSLTYALDTSAAGQPNTLTGPINGSGVLATTRSRTPAPEQLGLALAQHEFTVSANVVNQGYPGDTDEMIYSRWANQAAGDVLIWMGTTNDGKVLDVPVATSRYWLVCEIQRAIVKGEAMVLLTTPPINDRATEANLGEYRAMIREVAAEYGLLCVDTAEQLAGIGDLWSAGDNVHLSTFAYADLGWNLAALFVNRDLGGKSIAAGSYWNPQDGLGTAYLGELYSDARARSGEFMNIQTSGNYCVGRYVEDDVVPVIHSFTTNAADVVLDFQHAGNGVYAGIPNPELVHHAATDNRGVLVGPILRRGWRMFTVLVSGHEAFLDGFEFTALDAATLKLGWRKSDALSGFDFPRAQLTALGGAGQFVVQPDYSLPLKAPYHFRAKLELADAGGLAVLGNRQGQAELQDMLLIERTGNDMLLRDFVGATPTDTNAVGAFSAGTFTGELDIFNDGTTVTVKVDGTTKITATLALSGGVPHNTGGFPALITDAGQPTYFCRSAHVKGHGKAPYRP